jgi:hypothetical protein
LENPYRLVTWFDVLFFSAEVFAWCCRELRIIRSDSIIRCAVCGDGSEVGFALAQDLDNEARQRVLLSAETIERWYRSIGLNITAETVKELSADIDEGRRHSFQWLHDRIEGIERLASKASVNTQNRPYMIT